MTTHILVREGIIDNAETRHDQITIRSGEALAIIKSPYTPAPLPLISGFILEEITESEFETYEVFGITSLDWREVAMRRDDFNSWIFSERIKKALKRNGDLA